MSGATRFLKRVAGAFGYEVQRIRKRPPIVTSTRDPATLPRSIHYACGSVFLEGWLNVDARNRDGKDVFVMDLTKPHPFPNDFFEWGYSEDFVEHLTQPDSFLFLAELYRTFKPGGICRFSFPYLEGTLMYSENFRDHAAAARVKDFSYTQDEHLHLYSKDEFAVVCTHIGFKNVVFGEFGVSRNARLNGVDTRGGLNRMYVEVEK